MEFWSLFADNYFLDLLEILFSPAHERHACVLIFAYLFLFLSLLLLDSCFRSKYYSFLAFFGLILVFEGYLAGITLNNSVLRGKSSVLFTSTQLQSKNSKKKRNNLCQVFVKRNFTMTTTLGEKSLELIRESLRSRDMLGPFNEEKVRAVLEEIKALHDEVFTM